MAAITSNGTGGGDWGTGASWAGGVAPGGADTATIAVTDTITVTDARSILATVITGTLTIDTGGTLTFDGAVTGTGTLRVNAGGIVQLEATTASRTINVTTIMLRGVSGNRATIQSVNGTATTYGYFASSAAGKNALDIQYGRFYRLGNSSNANTIRGASETIDHLDVDTCGRLDRNVAADLTGSLSWTAVTTKNSAMSVAGSGRHFLPAAKNATYTNVVTDKDFWFDGTPTGTVTIANWITAGYVRLGLAATGGMPNLVASNLMATTVPANYQWDTVARGTINGFYSYQPAGGSAKHAFEVYDYPGGTLTLQNGVLEFGGNTSASDMVVNGDSQTNPAASTFNINNNIVLKNGTGTTDRSSGSLVALARGMDYETWNITNNTFYMAPKSIAAGSIAIVEGSSNSAIGNNTAIGMIKNNLGWAESGVSGSLVKVLSSRRSATARLIDSGTVTLATATSLTDSTVSPNWTTASGAATLFTDFPGAQVRILGARAQVVPIIGQVSSTELSVAAWTNGTPLVGDAYEIYMVDMLTAANTNYNGTWFGEAGTIYRPDTAATTVATTGYDGYYLTSGAPGANDVSGDPGFVDATRRLSTWDTSLGGLGTAANAIAELIKLNDDAGYNTSYTVANAIAYVQAGFQPTNTAYKAGSTGGWIGAVDGPTPVSTTRAAVVESRGAMATGRGALADARQGLLQLRIGLAEARQSIVQGRAALIEARGTATTPVSQTVIAIAESRGAIVQTRTALVETNAGLAIVRTSANEARGRAVMTITPLIEARQSLVQARAAAVESTRGLSQARVSLLEARGYVAVVRVSLTEARSTPRLTSNVITVEAWFAVTTERTVEF